MIGWVFRSAVFGLRLSLAPLPEAHAAAAEGPAVDAPLVAPAALEAPDVAAAASEAPDVAAAVPAPTTDVGAEMARRARLARVHRGLGISTFAAMTVTEVLGTIQYVNLYGVFASQGGTPCVRGTAIGGSEACLGQPVLHGVSAGLTTGLYVTTFAYAVAMPDPLGLDEGDSESAQRLRTHKRLRWIHLSGMVAQTLLGVVIANDAAFGLDRANHYRGLQALATVHLAAGFMTYGALARSARVMLRR